MWSRSSSATKAAPVESDITTSAVPAVALRVLIIEDVEDDAQLVVHTIRRGGYDVTWRRVETPTAMKAALAEQPWDVIVADYSLPRFNAPAALQLLQRSGFDIPFIIVSGVVGEETAVAAMKAGAHDYMAKGNLARLVPAIERELREAEERHERRRAELALREREQEEGELSAGLAQVGRELLVLLDTPALLERLCQLTTEVLSCDCSHTFLWKPEEDAFVPVAGFGDDPEAWEAIRVLKLARPVMAPLIERLNREEVVQLQDSGPPERSLPGFTTYDGATSSLYLALRWGGEIIGYHTARRGGGAGPFTPQQERLARGIAHLASLALKTTRLVEQLERAGVLKSEFVATISHELRTPLHVIMGYNELLLSGTFGPLSAEQADTLERSQMSSRALLDLITSTLDFSRLEQGRMPLTLTDVHLAQLLADFEAQTAEWPQKPDIAFEWNVAGDLPVVRTDAPKLKVVIKNLINNAVKFTDAGTVRVAAHRYADGVEIVVSDTGIGIPPETLPIIFEPFRQGDGSMTRRFGGVGLGLCIVQRLLDVLGATVTVESRVGQGSTFRIRMPARPAGTHDPKPRPSGNQASYPVAPTSI